MNNISRRLLRVGMILSGVFIMALSAGAWATAAAQSLEQTIKQLRQKEQELSDFRRDSLRPKEEEIRQVRDDFKATRDAVEIARTTTREARRVVSRLDAARREIQDKQFILSFSTVELAELFRKFDQATTNEEGIRIGRLIFRARFGLNRRPPNNFTRLSDVIFQEKIKFRREAVALIGPALVGIGQVLVKVVDIRTGALKPKDEAFGRFVGPLFKPIFTHLKIWSEILEVPILPQSQLSAEAKRVAADLTRIRDQDLFGHPEGREAAKRAAVEARASVEKRLAAEEDKYEKLVALLGKMDEELEKARAELDEKEAELAQLREREREMLGPIQDLRDKSNETVSREILNGGTGASNSNGGGTGQAQRETTGRRIGVKTGIVSLTDAEGLGRPTGLAMDELTSAITGLPTRLKATVASTYMIEEIIKCEECRRRSEDSDEVICTPRQVKNFRRVNIPSDTDAAIVADGEALAVTGRAVDGGAPGNSRVFAQLSSGVAAIRRENSVCGQITVVESGPAVDSRPGNAVDVFEVSNVRIEGVPEGRDSLDLFVIGARTEGKSFKERGALELKADAKGPNANRLLGAIRIPPRVTGRTRGLDVIGGPSSRTGFIARDGGANAEVLFLIKDIRGTTLERHRSRVTTSNVDTRTPGAELVMGDKGRFSVVIDGDADTSKLSVEWAISGASDSALGLKQTTGFSGKSANNVISFDSLDLAGATIQMRARVLEGTRLVASVSFPDVRLIARMSDLRFALVGSRISVAALDIFTPAPANALPGIELQLLDINGDRVEGGRNSRLRPSVRQEGLDVLRIGPNTEMNRTIEGRAIAGTAEVGSGLLVAELDLRQARERGVVFAGKSDSSGRLVENVLLTLNRLVIERHEGSQGEEFVLKAIGPAKMTGYRAEFTFGDGSSQATNFESNAFGGEARVPVNGRRFVRGDVARQSGTVVGSVSAELDGAPLPPPVVAVDIPAQGGAGGVIVVRGLIQNILHNDSFDLRCEWDVDGTLGAFKDPVTTVSPTGESGGICINSLTLSDDPANLNRDVGVSVKVSRQVGAGGGS